MTTWLCVLVLLLLTTSIWVNVKLVKKNLALSDQREELVDQIEEALDMLDVAYGKLAQASEIPVMADDPVIRDVVATIQYARNAVLTIASKVVAYGTNDDDDEDEGEGAR